MDCKELQAKFIPFVDDKLSISDLDAFLHHMDTCEECKEELSIQILVTEGVARLEEGNAFDLQNEIEKRLEEAKSRQRMHEFLLRLILIMLGVAVFALLIFCFVYFGFDI